MTRAWVDFATTVRGGKPTPNFVGDTIEVAADEGGLRLECSLLFLRSLRTNRN